MVPMVDLTGDEGSGRLARICVVEAASSFHAGQKSPRLT
jgi:hypothetical protein